MRKIGIVAIGAVSLVTGIGIDMQAEPVSSVDAQGENLVITDLCLNWSDYSVAFMAPATVDGDTEGTMYMNTDGEIVVVGFNHEIKKTGIFFDRGPDCLQSN